MSSILQWLEIEAKGKEVAYCIVLGIIAMFVMSTLGTWLLLLMGFHPFSKSTRILSEMTFIAFLFSGFLVAFAEELIFRAPLYLISLASRRLVIPVAVAISLLFGSLHGDLGNIAIQGFSGLILSVVFMKCGGLQDEPVKALMSSTATHYLFNSSLFVFVLCFR